MEALDEMEEVGSLGQDPMWALWVLSEELLEQVEKRMLEA